MLRKPARAVLGEPLSLGSGVVDVVQAEAELEPVRPLEVVQQTPRHVPANVQAVGYRSLQLREVGTVIFDSINIIIIKIISLNQYSNERY